MKSIIILPFLLLLLSMQFACNNDDSNDQTDEGDINESNYTQYGTPFTNIPDNQDVVMYEVNLLAFSEDGNLQGVTNRLDELQSLGVNVLWLMPIYPDGEINSVNSPYAVKNYKAVGEEYGTLEDLRTLTTEAHSRGMAVIVDWVANHTSWDNEWISNTSWYTQNSEGEIIHPEGTNWQDVADLNYDNQEMRLAMIDAMKFWLLEANIDGFRQDHADGVPYGFWSQAINSLEEIPEREFIFLAEGTRTNHFTAGFDLMYSWDFYYRLKDIYNGQPANILYSTSVAEYETVPEGKERLRYTTNHDETAWEGTPMEFFNGEQGALAASVAAIYMNGAPLFYTGQEVGTEENVPFFSNSPIDWNNNPEMFNEYVEIMDVYVNSEVARKGENTDYSTNDVIAFTKNHEGSELLVLINSRNSETTFNIPPALQNSNYTNAITNEDVSITVGNSINLNSYEYLILEKS